MGRRWHEFKNAGAPARSSLENGDHRPGREGVGKRAECGPGLYADFRGKDNHNDNVIYTI